MRFGSLVIKNLTRRPLRSTLTIVGLATAIAAIVALGGISRGFSKSFGDIYDAHSVDIVVSRQGAQDRLSSAIDETFVERIEELSQVDRAAAVLLETLSLEDEGIYGVPTMGIRSDSWILNDYELVDQIDVASNQSDLPEPKLDEQLPSLLLGVHLAERLGAQAGDSVNLFGDPHFVRGIYKSPSAWENGSMILPIQDLQSLTDRPGQATYINVVLVGNLSGEGAESAIQEIQALDNRLLPLATAEFVETDTRLRLASAMAWMTSSIALILGTIGTLNTMLMSVMERTREIGILRAIGWPKLRVIRMILLESCCLALLASLIGTVLALVATLALSQAPAVKGILSPSIDTSVIIQGFALAMGIGLLGAILPAWRAAQLMPTEAFRAT